MMHQFGVRVARSFFTCVLYMAWGLCARTCPSRRRGRRQIIVREKASVEADTLVIAFNCLVLSIRSIRDTIHLPGP